jgi:hypothetical protein
VDLIKHTDNSFGCCTVKESRCGRRLGSVVHLRTDLGEWVRLHHEAILPHAFDTQSNHSSCAQNTASPFGPRAPWPQSVGGVEQTHGTPDHRECCRFDTWENGSPCVAGEKSHGTRGPHGMLPARHIIGDRRPVLRVFRVLRGPSQSVVTNGATEHADDTECCRPTHHLRSETASPCIPDTPWPNSVGGAERSHGTRGQHENAANSLCATG